MIKIRSLLSGAFALMCGLSALTTASESRAAGPYEYPTQTSYYQQQTNKAASTYRGNEGYLLVWMTDRSMSTSGMKALYLCSAGATSNDCAGGVTYNRAQLLTWLALLQGAVHARGRAIPQFGTCLGAFANGCPTGFTPSW